MSEAPVLHKRFRQGGRLLKHLAQRKVIQTAYEKELFVAYMCHALYDAV